MGLLKWLFQRDTGIHELDLTLIGTAPVIMSKKDDHSQFGSEELLEALEQAWRDHQASPSASSPLMGALTFVEQTSPIRGSGCQFRHNRHGHETCLDQDKLPEFPEGWRCHFKVVVETCPELDLKKLRRLLEYAGCYIGLGYARALTDGEFGTFMIGEFDTLMIQEERYNQILGQTQVMA